MVRKYSFTFPVKGITKDNCKAMGRNGHFFLPRKFKDFEQTLKQYFLAQVPAGFRMFDKEDLCVSLIYFFKDKRHADCGNLSKSTLDAMNRCLWYDDRQIKSLSVDVNYGSKESIGLQVFNLE